MARAGFAVGLLMVLGALSPVDLPGEPVRTSSQVSPLGTFDVVTYAEKDALETTLELHLEFKNASREPQVLFRGGEATQALVAPDERWIVVNAPASGVAGFMHVFLRSEGGKYVSTEAEVERRALAALMKSRGLSKPPRFDVFFCYADFWAADSGCLLAHIEGRERGATKTSRFYFIYDPAVDRVSMDAGWLNRGAFESLQVR